MRMALVHADRCGPADGGTLMGPLVIPGDDEGNFDPNADPVVWGILDKPEVVQWLWRGKIVREVSSSWPASRRGGSRRSCAISQPGSRPELTGLMDKLGSWPPERFSA